MSANQSPSQPGILVSAMAVIVIAVVGSVAIDAFVKEAPRISVPDDPAPTARPSPPAPKQGVFANHGFGCPDFNDNQQAERLAIAREFEAMVTLIAARGCFLFFKGDRVFVRKRFGSYSSVRRPGDVFATYWTATSNIEPERAP